MPIQSNQPESMRQQKKTGQDCLWDAMIKHVFSRSWHCCKLLCKCSSSTHNYSYWWVNESVTSPLIDNPCHARKQRLLSINMNTSWFLAFSAPCSVLCSSASVFGALRKNNQLFYSLTMTLYSSMSLEYRSVFLPVGESSEGKCWISFGTC